MKIAEGKFHEEKLKLQQKHDADVQKVRTRLFQWQYIKQNNGLTAVSDLRLYFNFTVEVNVALK